MTKELHHFIKIHTKHLRRKVKRTLYRFLVDIYEGEIRFSLFHCVCGIFLLFLCVGFFFDAKQIKECPSTASVFGSELTNALRHAAAHEGHSGLDADVTLFLLPDTTDDYALSSFFDAPLYGFYLTGKEISYLPEFAASLSDSFVAGTPYIGGLSFSYNPKRLLYNRATDITLLTKEGTYAALSDDSLYYVIGTESVFSMFHYLSERTFYLLNIQPKNEYGMPVSDYSGRLLRGADGMHTFYNIYRSYLLQNASNESIRAASDIYICNSLNTIELFSQINSAGYFLIGNILLLFLLTAFARPHLHRVYIWFRIFLIHQKKRGKVTLRSRISTARVTRRNAA